jgi:hypothetical protein
MKKQITVATGERARINRLLSMPGKWLQVDIVLKDFTVGSQAATRGSCRPGKDFNLLSPLRPTHRFFSAAKVTTTRAAQSYSPIRTTFIRRFGGDSFANAFAKIAPDL